MSPQLLRAWHGASQRATTSPCASHGDLLGADCYVCVSEWKIAEVEYSPPHPPGLNALPGRSRITTKVPLALDGPIKQPIREPCCVDGLLCVAVDGLWLCSRCLCVQVALKGMRCFFLIMETIFSLRCYFQPTVANSGSDNHVIQPTLCLFCAKHWARSTSPSAAPTSSSIWIFWIFLSVFTEISFFLSTSLNVEGAKGQLTPGISPLKVIKYSLKERLYPRWSAWIDGIWTACGQGSSHSLLLIMLLHFHLSWLIKQVRALVVFWQSISSNCAVSVYLNVMKNLLAWIPFAVFLPVHWRKNKTNRWVNCVPFFLCSVRG